MVFKFFGWRRLISRVRFIQKLYLSELRKVRMNLRILTLGTEFNAEEVTYENGFVTVIYKERHGTNWIRITRYKVTINVNGRNRIF